MDLSERLEELMGFEVELEDLERLRLKPARSLSNTYYCPTCGWKVGKKNISTNLEEINRFCPYCGQKISRRE